MVLLALLRSKINTQKATSQAQNLEKEKELKEKYTLSLPDLPGFREIPNAPIVDASSSSKGTQTRTIELHPDVFTHPMPDIRLLHECVTWQETYKLVDDTHRINRDENFGDPRKPYRMNTSHTRRKDLKGPSMFLGTSKHAISGPWSMWSEFSEQKQAMAIRHALTVRFVQGDLEIFHSMPTMPKANEHLLIIAGEMTAPTALIQDDSKNVNVLPVAGLNVLSILKHEKLAIHHAQVRTIEKRLLDWERRYPFGEELDFSDTERHNFYVDSEHIEVSIPGKKHLAYDQTELDGTNKSWHKQNDMEPAISANEEYKARLPAEE